MKAMLSVRTLVALAAVFGALFPAFAGPLTPPVGVPSSTMKPLSEVEPRIAINAANTPGDADSLFRITQSGAYYLTGNITGVAGKHGIEIAASGVTLDLSGMRVAGVTGALNGIYITGGAVEVRDGMIHAWPNDGLSADGTSDTAIRRLLISFNGGMGARLGAYSVVEQCAFTHNASHGLRFYSVGRLTDSRAESNGNAGFSIDSGGSAISRCVAGENAGAGFFTADSNVFTDCTATFNSGHGFDIEDSVITGSNASYNGDSGFYLRQNAMATSCIATHNAENGFYISTNAVVNQCSAIRNGTASTSSFDSGYYIVGINARVSSSHAAGNKRGFYAATGANAFLAGNTAGGNVTAQFVISTGNDTGAVISNPGTGFTTTNPFANIAP